MTFVERVWYGEARSDTLVRAMLAPASLLYRGITSVRNALYDRGVFPVAPSLLPAVSVGNLTVGGTGKTPVSAWLAARFRGQGARPAIVLRGYGGDEPEVHALLNPDITVVVNADRARGVREAAGRSCDVAVLDDAFQHRQVSRLEDIVLVSADRDTNAVRLLPSGPWREGWGALSRATLVAVTRKAADAEAAAQLRDQVARRLPRGASAVFALSLDVLRDARSGTERPLSALAGRSVLLSAGIGDPASLVAQLGRAGARVAVRQFPDHHVYDSSDIARLARDAGGVDYLLCTLKDAVKLAPRWPREAPPLWYVSLRCDVEAGGDAVDALISRVLAARHAPTLR